MLEKFLLKTNEAGTGKIIGYHWPVENPSCAVCLIHGIGEYAGRYNRVAEYFNKEQIALLSMDLRGHGESFGKRGHCAPRAAVHQDIDQLLKYAQKTYPEAKIILYGHSMGGNIALDYKKRGNLNHLPAGYIISAPWIELGRPIPKYQYVFVKALAGILPQFLIGSNVPSDDLGNPKSVGNYDTDPLVHKKISALCALEGFDIGEALARGTLEDNGKAKEKPMLVMHGTEDKVCSINGSRQMVAHETCTYKEWPGLYHEIHNGGRDSVGNEVIQQMIDWVQELQD